MPFRHSGLCAILAYRYVIIKSEEAEGMPNADDYTSYVVFTRKCGLIVGAVQRGELIPYEALIGICEAYRYIGDHSDKILARLYDLYGNGDGYEILPDATGEIVHWLNVIE
ncbi:MAG TPA: hypothetical protein VJJ22_00815 [Candidatus Paceibacterota bacterium]